MHDGDGKPDAETTTMRHNGAGRRWPVPRCTCGDRNKTHYVVVLLTRTRGLRVRVSAGAGAGVGLPVQIPSSPRVHIR